MFDCDPADVTASGFGDDGRHVCVRALSVWAHRGAGEALMANARSQLSRSFSQTEQSSVAVEAAACAASAVPVGGPARPMPGR